MKLIPFNPYATDYPYEHLAQNAESRGEVIDFYIPEKKKFGRSSGRAKGVGGNVTPVRPEVKPACLRETRLLPQSDSENIVTREQMAPANSSTSLGLSPHPGTQQWAAGKEVERSLLVCGWADSVGPWDLFSSERKLKMSTRSAIIHKTATGYAGIYCHFDGYLDGVGKTLLTHYLDTDKVSRLIALGQISSLGERVEPIGAHSFDNGEDGTTVAYARDRSEKYRPPVEASTAEEVAARIGHNGEVYVFDGQKWTHNGVDLADALKAEAEQEETA